MPLNLLGTVKPKATPTAVKIYNIQADQDGCSLTFGRMNIVVVIVAAYVFAVGVVQAHAETEDDFDVSAVRLVRRARRVYIYLVVVISMCIIIAFQI